MRAFKNLISIILICFFFQVGSGVVCGYSAQADTGKGKVEDSIWLGTLTVPGGTKLRIAIEIFHKADGTLAAALSSPDQGAFGIPVDNFVFTADSARFEIKLANLVVAGKLQQGGNVIDGQFLQGPGGLPLVLTRVEEFPGPPARAQEPKKPYPYDEEEVVFENKAAGVKLSGTLTLPRAAGNFPAVVLIQGSGPGARDEQVFGHKPFLVLADYLTRQGIAVLRFDKRGIMRSTGDYSSATIEDFTGDVLAAVEYLKSRRRIDPHRIGLIGHSEGGTIAPMAAAKSPDVALIVLMAGPGLNGYENIVLQDIQSSRSEGATEEEIALIRPICEQYYRVAADEKDLNVAAEKMRKIYADLTDEQKHAYRFLQDGWTNQIENALSPGFRYSLTYDPRKVLVQVKCPVLAICGEKDVQVPPDENLAAIREGLESGGNEKIVVKKLAGLNHLFQPANSGAFSEYGEIEVTIAPEVLSLIGNWVLQITGQN